MTEIEVGSKIISHKIIKFKFNINFLNKREEPYNFFLLTAGKILMLKIGSQYLIFFSFPTYFLQ
jgi:hypothetical protein